MARIVCIGSALQDVFLKDHDDFDEVALNDGRTVFGSLKLGDKVDIDHVIFETGGGGTNVAVGLARGGHKAWFVGVVGRDIAGEAVLAALEKDGVNVDFVSYTKRVHTGYSTVLLAPSGERTILTYRGAAGKHDSIDTEVLHAARADWVYAANLGGELDAVKEIFGHAAEHGVKVMWNPGIREIEHKAEMKRLLRYVDVLLVNKQEAEAIVGVGDLPTVAKKLMDVVETVVVTDGARGAVAGNSERLCWAGLYDEVRVVDATGAGDAFGSGFLSEYAKSGDFARALVRGAANSTAVVQKIGAKAGLLGAKTKLHEMEVKEL
jgi:ribokinase